MAVDAHPSRKPTKPFKPPATSTTDGQANTVSKTMQGWGEMEYGSRNGKDLRVVKGAGTTMAHHFGDYGSMTIHPDSADKPAHSSAVHNAESSMGGQTKGKVTRAGDENDMDEPG